MNVCSRGGRSVWLCALYVVLCVMLWGCKEGTRGSSSKQPQKSKASKRRATSQPSKRAGGKKGYAARMAQEHKDDKPVASAAAKMKPRQPVKGDEVVYGKLADKKLRGYLARPKAAKKAKKGKLPALIVIHEWWGLNDNIRAMTRRLAGEGYLALAVDLYEGKFAQERKGAYKLMSAAMKRSKRLKENLKLAYHFLRKKHGAKKIASIGWCFGGAWSLQTALLFPKKLNAAVIYYGRLNANRKALRTLQMPILGIFGAKDKGIPLSTVKQFEAVLKALKKKATIKIYKDADHAFANPSGKRFNPKAAADAWKLTRGFLKEHLLSHH